MNAINNSSLLIQLFFGNIYNQQGHCKNFWGQKAKTHMGALKKNIQLKEKNKALTKLEK